MLKHSFQGQKSNPAQKELMGFLIEIEAVEAAEAVEAVEAAEAVVGRSFRNHKSWVRILGNQ